MPHSSTGSLRFSLRDAGIILFRYKRRMLLTFAVPLVLAILALLVLPNRYSATASVLIKTGREYLSKEGAGQTDAGPQVTKQEVVNSEIEMMTSRQTAETTISRLGGVAALYRSLAKQHPSHGTIMDNAIDVFLRRLTVAGVKLSDVVDLQFSDSKPERAKLVLQTLLQVYQEEHLAAFQSAHDTAVLKQNGDVDLADLTRLETQLTQLKLQNGIYDIDQQRQSLISQRAEGEDQLNQAELREQTLRQRIAFLGQTVATLPTRQSATETDKVEGTGTLAGVMVDMRRQESDLLSRYGPDHPLVVQLQQQIAGTQKAIDATKKDFIHVKTDADPVTQQVDQELVLDKAELAPIPDSTIRLRANLAQLNAKLEHLEGADLQERLLISRIAAIDEYLKTSRAEYARSRASDDLDQQHSLSVSVIQQPIVLTDPTSPKKLLFIAAGLLFGMIGAATVFLYRLWTNDDVLSHHGIEQIYGVPVLAILPPLTKWAGVDTWRDHGAEAPAAGRAVAHRGDCVIVATGPANWPRRLSRRGLLAGGSAAAVTFRSADAGQIALSPTAATLRAAWLHTASGRSGLAAAAAARGVLFGTAARPEYIARDPAYAATLVKDMQLISPEIHLNWRLIERRQGVLDFGAADELFGFIHQHGMAMRGHTLLWHRGAPDWFVNDIDSNAAPAVLRKHMRDMCAHYAESCIPGMSSMSRWS